MNLFGTTKHAGIKSMNYHNFPSTVIAHKSVRKVLDQVRAVNRAVLIHSYSFDLAEKKI
jgi:protein tyrosine/serine phosphatase